MGAPNPWLLTKRQLEDSPSRRDGVDPGREKYVRRTYVGFLAEAGFNLRVPQLTIATATILCHRFFTRKSVAEYDRYLVATTCLFLAGKVEESPKPLREVLSRCHNVLHKPKPGSNAKPPQLERADYDLWREKVLDTERIVLTTLGFDFQIDHPYRHLLACINSLEKDSTLKAECQKVFVDGSNKKIKQFAWNFVNDSLRTTLALEYNPRLIGAGALSLAAKFQKVTLERKDLGHERNWWEVLGVSLRSIEDIEKTLLEIYDERNPARRPPHLDATKEQPTPVQPKAETVKAERDAPALAPGDEPDAKRVRV